MSKNSSYKNWSTCKLNKRINKIKNNPIKYQDEGSNLGLYEKEVDDRSTTKREKNRFNITTFLTISLVILTIIIIYLMMK